MSLSSSLEEYCRKVVLSLLASHIASTHSLKRIPERLRRLHFHVFGHRLLLHVGYFQKYGFDFSKVIGRWHFQNTDSSEVRDVSFSLYPKGVLVHDMIEIVIYVHCLNLPIREATCGTSSKSGHIPHMKYRDQGYCHETDTDQVEVECVKATLSWVHPGQKLSPRTTSAKHMLIVTL